MKNTMKNLIVCLAGLLLPVSAFAADLGTKVGSVLTIPVNARAGGAGMCYSAVGNDGSAIHYNPAGLALVQSYGVNLMHRIMGDELSYEYGAVSVPLPIGVLGFEGGYVGIAPFQEFASGTGSGKTLTYSDLFFSVGFAKEFANMISLGLYARYWGNTFGIKDTSDYYAVNTITFGLGALFAADILDLDKNSEKNFRLGAAVHNLGPGMKYISTIPMNMTITSGLFWQPLKFLDLVADVSLAQSSPLSFGAGVELLPQWLIPIRGGFRNEGGKFTWTAGAGIQYQAGSTKFGFDYALNIEPERGLTHWFSLVIQKFMSTLAEFSFGNIKMVDIFPGMYKYYAGSKVAQIEIKNNSNLPIENVKVSVFVKDFMDFPSESDPIPVVQPKSVKKVDLSASFNNKILGISEDTPSQAQFKVSYYAEGKQLELNQTKNFKLYNRSAMTWDLIDKLSSFITPKDPPVKIFARGIFQSFKDVDLKGVNDRVAKAALLFDALGKFGITYVVAPESPMLKRGTTTLAVDYIQFPRDSLRFKSAKCADETALFCSLMQNLGINTALCDLQDHILMIFDTSVPESDRYMVSADENRILIRNGTVWVPVETTMYGQTFADSWTFAAKEIREGQANGRLTIVDVLRAWEQFPPVTLEDSSWEPQLPTVDEIRPMFDTDLTSILSFGINNKVKWLEDRVAQNPADTESLNNLGILYGQLDQFDKAVAVLNQAIQKSPNEPKFYNNLGNVYVLQENYPMAEKSYLKAVQLKPDNAGYYINLAILYGKMGDMKKAKDMTDKAEKLIK